MIKGIIAIASVLMSCPILLAGFLTIGTIGAIPYKFMGEEMFVTFEEAQTFQTQLVKEAERVGASVESFDMSITSPPKVTYRVFMPDKSEFKYGERLTPFGGIYAAQVVLGIALVIFAIVFNVQFWQESRE